MSTPELDWFKSSYSSAQGDSCIEVAVTEQAIHVRDSKDVTRRPFAVGREEWAYFVEFAAGA
ncbi:DUF397 domain-containing protein [Streptomyces sp. BSE7-9]|uniref:DUF397 domain-containing protein n=1 Tax=Streptomyces sp. BSE7-9 TaxID=2759948 RepID=UPI0018EE8EF9|nr:DUF397 domain-containing protein [Streptomyces sp. BSE7-9]MBJ6642707.1 DUF397 domain-containing protein [Streptomyces sp. BSE7-9]